MRRRCLFSGKIGILKIVNFVFADSWEHERRQNTKYCKDNEKLAYQFGSNKKAPNLPFPIPDKKFKKTLVYSAPFTSSLISNFHQLYNKR